MQAEYSPSFLQTPDTQTLGGAFLGGEGDIYNKAAKPMKSKKKKILLCGIYSITNPDGETYIGRSVDIYARTSRYGPNMRDHQWKLKASMEKFGKYQHLIQILEECTESLLDERESHYKQLFVDEKGWDKALFYRINDTEPHTSTEKAVKVWTLDAKLIGEYKSSREACRVLDLDPRHFSSAARGSSRLISDYQVRFADSDIPVVAIEKKTRQAIPVIQLTMGDEFVAEYSSCYAASKSNGFAGPSKIQMCVHGQRKTYKGYKWIKKNK